jgi:hypothetical protein
MIVVSVVAVGVIDVSAPTCMLLRSHTDFAALWSWWEVGFLSSELAAIELVRIFEGGDVAGSGRKGSSLEVRMLQGVDGIETFAPIETEEVGQERDGTLRTMSMTLLSDGIRKLKTLLTL